jgi:hypothetical protein
MFNSITTALWNKKYIVLFFAVFLIVLSQRFLNIHQNGLVNSVSSDGLGYYSYLPAAIIYQDFDYTYYEKKENKINPFIILFIIHILVDIRIKRLISIFAEPQFV